MNYLFIVLWCLVGFVSFIAIVYEDEDIKIGHLVFGLVVSWLGISLTLGYVYVVLDNRKFFKYLGNLLGRVVIRK